MRGREGDRQTGRRREGYLAVSLDGCRAIFPSPLTVTPEVKTTSSSVQVQVHGGFKANKASYQAQQSGFPEPVGEWPAKGREILLVNHAARTPLLTGDFVYFVLLPLSYPVDKAGQPGISLTGLGCDVSTAARGGGLLGNAACCIDASAGPGLVVRGRDPPR
ncbi:unnamed protein product [Pleuronectes platessa]|uniref:Uncharacterized protein n=1 Tax=Pleuronectes platessa TaxID=8262 RepID=A0A9N7VJ45_PLEPL|nr:unnamed protein product [Pleuronectes platessa]